MRYEEYKIEPDKTIRVPYNKNNVAPITKELVENLIKTVNISYEQAKILEYIKLNYSDKMVEQYNQGRLDERNKTIKLLESFLDELTKMKEILIPIMQCDVMIDLKEKYDQVTIYKVIELVNQLICEVKNEL